MAVHVACELECMHLFMWRNGGCSHNRFSSLETFTPVLPHDSEKHSPHNNMGPPVPTQSPCLHPVVLLAADTHAHRIRMFQFVNFGDSKSESELDANKTKHGQLNDFRIETQLWAAAMDDLSIARRYIRNPFSISMPNTDGGRYLGPRLWNIHTDNVESGDGRLYRSILSE